MKTTTLKPGLLVSLKTRVKGGIEYTKRDLAAPEAPTPGAESKRWETTRLVKDPETFRRAQEVRSKCQSLVRGSCIPSDFGLLCLSAKEKDLDAAIVEADRMAEAFNQGESGSVRVEVYVLRGRIADSDSAAARAVASEIRELLDGMNKGISDGDPTAIRDAASRAKKLGTMLDEATGAKVKAAIEEARNAARAITARVVKGGELAEKVVKELNLKSLEQARVAFLDLDGPAACASDEAVGQVDVGRAAGLDIDSGAEPVAAAPVVAPLPEVDAPAAPAAKPAAVVNLELEF